MEERPQEDLISHTRSKRNGLSIIEKRRYKLQSLRKVLKSTEYLKELESRTDYIFQPNQLAYFAYLEELAETKTKVAFYNQQWECLVNKNYKK